MMDASTLLVDDDIRQQIEHYTVIRRKEDGYWQIVIDRKVIYLHRWIMDAPRGVVVEHRDGNRSNNQRSNLRATSQSVNKSNPNDKIPLSASGVRGVVPQRDKWRAQIYRDGVRYNLGTFDTIEEAVKCRQQAEKEYHHEHHSRD
jgi:hypothetical protein